MLVFYHSRDLDGVASAAVIRHLRQAYNEVELIGFDYGQAFPWERIAVLPTDATVVMVDVSLPMVEMTKLQAGLLGRFLWIDHHKSAIEAAGQVPFAGLQRVGTGACALAWEFFNTDQFKPMPEAIKRLSEYDVWQDGNKVRWNEFVIPFQFGLRSAVGVYDPEKFVWWGELLSGDYILSETALDGYTNDGRAILRYQRQQNAEIMKRCGFRCTLVVPAEAPRGYAAIACNSPFCNSQLFDGVYDESLYDLMLSYYLGKDGRYTVSLYTTKESVDVSAIAKAFGGGGHAKAAGFVCAELPIECRVPT